MIYGGGIGLACALLEGGLPKCVHMRAEGGRGSKKAKKLRAHYMDGPLRTFKFKRYAMIASIELRTKIVLENTIIVIAEVAEFCKRRVQLRRMREKTFLGVRNAMGTIVFG